MARDVKNKKDKTEKRAEAKSVFDDLFSRDKKFAGAVRAKLQSDEKLLVNACNFVQKKIGRGNVIDFAALSPDLKLPACLDYLAIGVISGQMDKKDVLDLIKDK